MKVSAVIITYNEEEKIGRCIKSLAFADEIIVVDSGSRDNTVKIAAAMKAKIFSRGWQGYSRQKNYAVGKSKNEWVLSVDADEEVSRELADEIAGIVISPYEGVALRR